MYSVHMHGVNLLLRRLPSELLPRETSDNISSKTDEVATKLGHWYIQLLLTTLVLEWIGKNGTLALKGFLVAKGRKK